MASLGLSLLVITSALAAAAPDVPLPDDPNAPAAKKGAKAAPLPSLGAVEDVPGLPRVLIIGDSISIGYTLPVRKLLEGKANVHRIPTNGGPTKNGVTNLTKWLWDTSTKKWDVIHFNWGIHDLKHMPDGKRQVEPADYEANLRKLVAQMKATGARLIWATTTPIPEGPLNPSRTFGSVAEYNEIAAKVMKENDVAVDDLNGQISPKVSTLQNPKDVHFNAAGSAFLAKAVAGSIEKALPAKKS
ncbi:MAG: SGNH/GDSL hydrolase family protein [Verrucomicrobium sp.]